MNIKNFVHKSHLIPGRKAPGFRLKSTPDQYVELKDYLGKSLVIIFYPSDWNPLCSDQMALYNEILPEFEKLQANVIGISCDSSWSHAAYRHHNNINFPLLSDFEPKGKVSQLYGVYRMEEGVSERALFVIDKEGVVFWSYISPYEVNPDAAGVLSALENLTLKEAV